MADDRSTTGPCAMRKWLVRIALTLLLLGTLALLGGAAYESLGARNAAQDYPQQAN